MGLRSPRLFKCVAWQLFLLHPAGSAVAAGPVDAANAYPEKPVRWVVPFAPGGSSDPVMRVLAGRLGERWGQQFVIDNRPGAGGLLGGDIVAKAVPDGYTLLVSNPGPSVGSPLLAKKAPYKVTDFSSVIFLGYMPLIIVATQTFGPNNPSELLSYLRANPGKANWGSSGYGGSTHVGQMLFKMATKTEFTHIAYKGSGPALIDLIGGQIHLMYASTASAEAQIKAGRVKVIGVASARRMAILPGVPTLAESGIKDADALSWYGLSAPLRTPSSIVAKLNLELNKILSVTEVKRRFDELGFEVTGGSPQDFDRFLEREIRDLRKLIGAGALTPEN